MLATYQPWLIHVDIGCTNSGKRDLPWYRTWQKLYLPRMHLFPTSGNHEVNALIHLSDMPSISRGLRKINIILKQPMPHAGYWKTAHYGLTNSKGLNSPSAEEWLCRSSLMFQRCISNLLALSAFSLFRLSQSPSQRDQQTAKNWSTVCSCHMRKHWFTWRWKNCCISNNTQVSLLMLRSEPPLPSSTFARSMCFFINALHSSCGSPWL